MGTISKVGDASDREAWLEGRKQRLGASEITGWIGPSSLPKKYAWFFADNTREGIIAEKWGGVPKEFTGYSQVSMAHGAHDEKCIIEKVGEMLACPVQDDNSQFTNSRWPGIAATVDGYIGYDPTTEPGTMYCQDPDQVTKVLHGLSRLEEGDMTVLEIKKSVSVGWARNEIAPYYVNQCQSQMHILDRPFCVIAADCIFKSPTEKWRLFWDLRCFIIERDEAWANTLDRVSAEFLEAKEQHGA